MGNKGRVLLITADIVWASVAFGIGLYNEDPVYLSTGVIMLSGAAIYWQKYQMEQKLDELRRKIDRLAMRVSEVSAGNGRTNRPFLDRGKNPL